LTRNNNLGCCDYTLTSAPELRAAIEKSSARMPDQNADPAGHGNAYDTPSAENKALSSLKYHLLGPSLMKAGQESVDQSKVKHPQFCHIFDMLIA